MCDPLKKNNAAVTVFLSNLFFTIMNEEDIVIWQQVSLEGHVNLVTAVCSCGTLPGRPAQEQRQP